MSGKEGLSDLWCVLETWDVGVLGSRGWLICLKINKTPPTSTASSGKNVSSLIIYVWLCSLSGGAKLGQYSSNSHYKVGDQTRLGQAGVDTHRYSNYALTIPHTLISVLLLAITTRFFSEKKRQVFGNNFNFARCVNWPLISHSNTIIYFNPQIRIYSIFYRWILTR